MIVVGIGIKRELCHVYISKVCSEVKEIAKVQIVLIHRILSPRGFLGAVHSCASDVGDVENKIVPHQVFFESGAACGTPEYKIQLFQQLG